jgi:hypothetical protein
VKVEAFMVGRRTNANESTQNKVYILGYFRKHIEPCVVQCDRRGVNIYQQFAASFVHGGRVRNSIGPV